MCPVCGYKQFNFTSKCYKKCLRCGAFSIVGLPRAQEVEKVTEESSEGIINDQRRALVEKDYLDRFNRFKKYLKKSSVLLDFGCGSGLFVRFIISKGHKAKGFDKSRKLSDFLEKSNTPFFRSLNQIPNNHFEVITNFDVIEHTVDPRKLIKEIKSKLTKNGVLVLTTPNAYGISARLLKHRWWVFGPAFHYIMFSMKSLKYLLEKEELEVVKIRTDTLTPWFTPMNALWCKFLNKVVYLSILPFKNYIFNLYLGDNIEIIVRKK